MHSDALTTWLRNTQGERKRKTKTLKGRNSSIKQRHPLSIQQINFWLKHEWRNDVQKNIQQRRHTVDNGALEEKHPHCIQAATKLKEENALLKTISTKWNKKIKFWRISFLTLSPRRILSSVPSYFCSIFFLFTPFSFVDFFTSVTQQRWN